MKIKWIAAIIGVLFTVGIIGISTSWAQGNAPIDEPGSFASQINVTTDDTLLDLAPDKGGPRGIARRAALEAIAKALGMTSAQVQDALQAGQSVADLAQTKGVDLKTIQSTVIAAEKAQIDQALKDGKLTQAQADKLKAALDNHADKVLALLQKRYQPGNHPIVQQARQTALDAAASTLGLTSAQLKDDLKAGQSITAVAKAKGIDLQTIQNAVVAAEKAQIDQAVKDSKLTQAQADKLKAAIEKRVDKILEQFKPQSGTQ